MVDKRPTSDNWETPKWIMVHMNDIQFDPCPRHWTFDGLNIHKWRSPVFINPPYSKPEPWIDKAIEQQKLGVDIMLLLRVDPSTKWYKKLVESGGHFAYFNERLKFSESKGSPNFASMLVFLEGKHVIR